MVAPLQIKVSDPVRAFCRTFRLDSPRTSVEEQEPGAHCSHFRFPRHEPGRAPCGTTTSASRVAAALRALFKPEQLLIIASREALSQNRGQPVDQPHAAERLSPSYSRRWRRRRADFPLMVGCAVARCVCFAAASGLGVGAGGSRGWIAGAMVAPSFMALSASTPPRCGGSTRPLGRQQHLGRPVKDAPPR